MRKGILYTSYFSKIADGIGFKISIAHRTPVFSSEDISIGRCWSLAPSIELLCGYKKGHITWEQYTARYYDALKESVVAQSTIEKMREHLDSGGDITVYCYEKPTINCHRHLLAKLFQDFGYETREIE